MHVYFISGLGADQRVFNFLELPGISMKFISWIEPSKGESLTQYARRLISQIDLTERVILVGISYGGIIAQEIAALVQCEKVIIISSVKSPAEFSFPLRFVRLTRLYKLFPTRFLQWASRLTADYFFTTKSRDESKLLHQIIKDTDGKFLGWSVRQIMVWQGTKHSLPVTHIHGTRDRIFPAGRIKNFTPINDGGHFMIVSQAKDLSEVLMRELSASEK